MKKFNLYQKIKLFVIKVTNLLSRYYTNFFLLSHIQKLKINDQKNPTYPKSS